MWYKLVVRPVDFRMFELVYMLFVLRCKVACRSCSILKSSTVRLSRIMWCMIKSSVRYLGGGDRSTAMVSHIPLHDFRTLADPKQAPSITSATLNITLMPSHRKQSQIRNNVSHGNVLVMAHKNQSVIWKWKKKFASVFGLVRRIFFFFFCQFYCLWKLNFGGDFHFREKFYNMKFLLIEFIISFDLNISFRIFTYKNGSTLCFSK